MASIKEIVVEHFRSFRERWEEKGIKFSYSALEKILNYSDREPGSAFDLITKIDEDLGKKYFDIYGIISNIPPEESTDGTEESRTNALVLADIDLNLKERIYAVNLSPLPERDIVVDREKGEVINRKTGIVVERLTAEELKEFSPYEL